jgi:hypothetical protein
VHIAAAQLIERDRFAGDDPDHLRAGDEHVSLSGHDEDEIRDRG